MERKVLNTRKGTIQTNYDNAYVIRLNTTLELNGNTANLDSIQDALQYEFNWKRSTAKIRFKDKKE